MDVSDRTIYQFIPNDKISIKTANRTNSNIRHLHQKAKLLNIIWNLNLISHIKLFARTLIRRKIQTCDQLTNLGINIVLIVAFAEQMKKILIAYAIRLALLELFGQIKIHIALPSLIPISPS